jgi:hypothetical protein
MAQECGGDEQILFIERERLEFVNGRNVLHAQKQLECSRTGRRGTARSSAAAVHQLNRFAHQRWGGNGCLASRRRR